MAKYIKKSMAPFCVPAFFALLLVSGLATYSDYGFSYDEVTSRDTGRAAMKKILGTVGYFDTREENAEALGVFADFHLNFYGSFYETLLCAAEVGSGKTDIRDIYLFRHLLQFLFFFGTVILFYFMVRQRFRDWRYALAGCLMLVLHPRIYAHAFFNPKDLPFMSFYMLAAFSAAGWMRRWDWRWGVLHGAACGMAIAVRMQALMVPVFTVGLFLVYHLQTEDGRARGKRSLFGLGLFAAFLVGSLIVCYPFLWDAPLANFIYAYKRFANYSWYGAILTGGVYLKSADLPWYYIPVWMGWTTPVMFSILFLFGLGAIGWRVIRRPWPLMRSWFRNQEILHLGLITIPWAAVVVLGATLYDGWRHFYFIYPSFILVALVGFRSVQRVLSRTARERGTRVMRWILPVLLGIGFVQSGWVMWRSHPYQHVYFNVLAGQDLMYRFELDYWGLSYREALEYVMRDKPEGEVKVYVASLVGVLSQHLLLPEDRKRLVYVDDPGKAEYFLSNFRSARNRQLMKNGTFPYSNEVFAVVVRGVKIMTVHKYLSPGKDPGEGTPLAPKPSSVPLTHSRLTGLSGTNI